MKINLIVCVDKNFGISKNGSIPWKIKEDLNFFQDMTKIIISLCISVLRSN